MSRSLLNRSRNCLAIGLVGVLLASCGSDDSVFVSPSLSGTVATGAPVVGANISVKCSTNTYSATTNNNGRYGINVPATNFPCAVQATGGSLGTNTLYSVASGSGTTNVTPLTSLITALQVNTEAGQLLADWFDDPSSSLSAVSDNLKDAADTLRTALLTAGYSLIPDWTAGTAAPVTMSFTPNPASDPYDMLLEALQEAIDANATTFDDLLADFVAGSALPDDNSPLPAPGSKGSVLGKADGVTGTLNGSTLTYTNVTMELIQSAVNENIIKIVGGGDTDNWTIENIPEKKGSYHCTAVSDLSISLNNAGVESVASDCYLEVISVSDHKIEGRFTAKLDSPDASGVGKVLDGYFRYGSGVVSTGVGIIPADGVATTVHANVAKTYTGLKFHKGGGAGCGSTCSFSDGQSVAVKVTANGVLTVAGKSFNKPFNRKYGGLPHLYEVIWSDGVIEYALSDNLNGAFNELNVGKATATTPVFLGQIR